MQALSLLTFLSPAVGAPFWGWATTARNRGWRSSTKSSWVRPTPGTFSSGRWLPTE